jgi:hypothetical protein
VDFSEEKEKEHGRNFGVRSKRFLFTLKIDNFSQWLLFFLSLHQNFLEELNGLVAGLFGNI